MKKRKYHHYRPYTTRAEQLLAVSLIAIFSLFPLYYIFITSLKPSGSEYKLPLEFWPSHPTLQAYRTILGGDVNFLVPLRNSFIVSSSVTILTLLLSGLAAYAIARLRFRHKIFSLLFLLMGWVIPLVSTLSPTFMLLRTFGLLRTLPGLIIPNTIYNVPLCTWLLACYFAEIPFEIDDAAKVDGYRPLQIFWRVIMPLSAPGFFSAGIFAFLGSWGEFMLASIVTMGMPSAQTVPVAILNFSLNHRLQWTWISAGIIVSVTFIVLLVAVFQRWVIRGLTAGSVKY